MARLYVAQAEIDLFREAEQRLSNVEAELAQLAFEPFPEHPGPDSPEIEVEAWLRRHDERSHRLTEIVTSRAVLLNRLRDMLVEPPVCAG